jgi:hypothetical protein
MVRTKEGAQSAGVDAVCVAYRFGIRKTELKPAAVALAKAGPRLTGVRIASRRSVVRALLGVVVPIAAFATFAGWLLKGHQRTSYEAFGLLVLSVAGVLGLIDGFTLAVLEENRSRYGHVVTGIVEDLGTSDLSIPTTSPLRFSEMGTYEQISRFLLTRSPEEYIVQYSYPCAGATGSCRVREQITRDLWTRLNIGQPVNVRQSIDETRTARLDQNPQRGLALVKVALACVLLGLAGLMSGRFTPFRRQKYIEVHGIVTSVRAIQYGDETRWKVHFAYFDDKGNAQESVDEVNDPSWKSGDDCRAVYRPRTPDLATLRPRSAGV